MGNPPAILALGEALGASDHLAIAVLGHDDGDHDGDVLAGAALWRSTTAVANLIPLSLGILSVVCPDVAVKPHS